MIDLTPFSKICRKDPQCSIIVSQACSH